MNDNRQRLLAAREIIATLGSKFTPRAPAHAAATCASLHVRTAVKAGAPPTPPHGP